MHRDEYPEFEHLRLAGPPSRLRILFLGMPGVFSVPPLLQLIAARHELVGVITIETQTGTSNVPDLIELRPPPVLAGLALLNPFVEQTILQVAWQHAIPVWQLARLSAPSVHELWSRLAPNLVVVACFPRRIPASLLEVPSLGTLNIHPSLLPAHRGPAPVFWTLHAGETTFGVTLHRLEATLDTGPIVAQAVQGIADGLSGPDIDLLLSTRGAALLVGALAEQPSRRLSARTQPSGGSYEGWPSAEDFTLNPAWSARRAFNFMRGTAEWGRPYPLVVGAHRFLLSTAVAFAPSATIPLPYSIQGDQIVVQFTPGTLTARL